MQRTTSQIRRQRWRHAPLFGLPLAFLELGITFVVLLHSSQIFGTDRLRLVAILSYLARYLIIPLIAGYHFTYHSRNDSANSGWAGLGVGCVSFVLVAFVQTVFAGIAFV
jgi:hypothetical protein